MYPTPMPAVVMPQNSCPAPMVQIRPPAVVAVPNRIEISDVNGLRGELDKFKQYDDSELRGKVEALEAKSEQDPQFGAWKTDVLPRLLAGKADSSVEGRVDALERKSEQDPQFGAWKTDVLPRLLAGKADVALVDAKVDEFTPWRFDGDDGDWSIVFHNEEREAAPEGAWFADLLDGGELVHTVAVESPSVTSVSFRWGEDGMVDATRLRVLRTGDAVSSVNGQTGTVALNAMNIPYNEDGDTIEEAVNGLAQTTVPHLENFNNPHGVTAKQVGAYTTGEVDGKLAAKADELTPWVPAGTVGYDYPPDLKDQPTFSDGVWRWVSEDFGEFRTGAGQTVDAVSITLQSAESETAIFTATRKRVLRTGDADKLTDAQKAVISGGPYVPMSVGDEEAYKTARIQAASQARLLIDSGLEAVIKLSSGDETVQLSATGSSGASIKKNGKEVATEESKRYELYSPSPYGNVFRVNDFAVNTILLASPGEYVIEFPPPVGNRARDFVVKVKVTSGTLPTITFRESAGMSALGFESTDDKWATLELGINYFSFTESER